MIKLIFFSSLIFFLPLVFGSVCPLDDDFVCNNQTKHSCRCVAPVTTLNPIRLVHRYFNEERFCNDVVNTTDPEFKALSIKFELEEEDGDEKSDHHNSNEDNDEEEEETVDEEEIRLKIAKVLKIEQDRIILLELECVDDDANLTVKFVVLKNDDELAKLRKSDDDDSDEDDEKNDDLSTKNLRKKVDDDNSNNDDEDDDDKKKLGKTVEIKANKKDEDDSDEDDEVKIKVGKDDEDDDDNNDEKDEDDNDEDDDEDDFEPYEPEHLEDPYKILKNLTKIRKGSTLADLKVSAITLNDDVSDFEWSFTDTILLIALVGLIVGVVLVSILVCYILVRRCRARSGYSDTLQRS